MWPRADRLTEELDNIPTRLAVLKRDPDVKIEEPELGLHFDMMPKLAALLNHASEHTQLIVTTHSDILVDALQGAPQHIVVCDKGDDGTALRRFDPTTTSVWGWTMPGVATWRAGSSRLTKKKG